MSAGNAQRRKSETEFLAIGAPLNGTIAVQRLTADVEVGDAISLPLTRIRANPEAKSGLPTRFSGRPAGRGSRAQSASKAFS